MTSVPGRKVWVWGRRNTGWWLMAFTFPDLNLPPTGWRKRVYLYGEKLYNAEEKR